MRISDWSSDVCSSDLGELGQYEQAEAACLESVATLDQIRAPGLLEKWAMAEAQAMLAYPYERAGKPRAAIDARRRQIELTEDGPQTADYRSSPLPRIGDLQSAIGERKLAEQIGRAPWRGRG